MELQKGSSGPSTNYLPSFQSQVDISESSQIFIEEYSKSGNSVFLSENTLEFEKDCGSEDCIYLESLLNTSTSVSYHGKQVEINLQREILRLSHQCRVYMNENQRLKAELVAVKKENFQIEEQCARFFTMSQKQIEELKKAEKLISDFLGQKRSLSENIGLFLSSRVELIISGYNQVKQLLENTAKEKQQLHVVLKNRSNTDFMVKELHKRLTTKDNVIKQLQAQIKELTKDLKVVSRDDSVADEFTQAHSLDLKESFFRPSKRNIPRHQSAYFSSH